MGKGLNIIPLKNMNNVREHSPNYLGNLNNNERISPKNKDLKLPNTNLSPKNHYMPTSTKNTTEKINFEMKFGSRINLNNKSPSPKHMDFISRLKKSQSPENKYEKK